ncbi:MFS transporter fsa7 [Cladobotryum mycophilum]|uniref:MFS transporter fsa7 n=1 Tax=Cladobotryum mycophilum TaxID=491253 RepID=A0ABR0SJE8_9HYPO
MSQHEKSSDENSQTDVEQGSPELAIGRLDWDGPDDSENPLNWPTLNRNMQIIIVALILFIVNLASTMYAPGEQQLQKEFGFHSTIVGTLTVSIFVLGYAIGPLVWAPLSELYGRLWVYAASSILFLAFLIGSAFATSTGQFIAFRIISGMAGGCTQALCGATVADVTPREKRGKWMSWVVLGPAVGPCVGPIMGGFITQGAGWRWIFRVLVIACGSVLILAVFYLRETHAGVIIRRRAIQRGYKHVDEKEGNVSSYLLRATIRPLKLLVLSPIVLALSTYVAIAFGTFFILLTSFPQVFESQYGFTTGTSGLAYLAIGMGSLFGLIIYGVFSDRMVKARAAKTGSSKPEDRLPLMAYFSPSIAIGIFWYGWTVDKHVHWSAPIIGSFFIGMGVVFCMMPCMVYLVDAFGAEAAASAMAAFTLLRSIAGAFLPIAGPPLYRALGLGWGNSLLGFISVALIPIPWIFMIYGERIRLSRKVTL